MTSAPLAAQVIVSAATIQMHPDDGLEDGLALRLYLAQYPGAVTIQFSAGQYDFGAGPAAHIRLENRSNVLLRGDPTGTTRFVFDRRDRRGVMIFNSDGCGLEHLSLGFRRQPFVEGTIIALDRNGGHVDVNPDGSERKPLTGPDALVYLRAESLISFDPATNRIREQHEQLSLASSPKVTNLNYGALRFHMRTNYDFSDGVSGRNVRVGDRVVVKAGLLPTIWSRNTRRLRLAHLEIRNSGSAGIASALDSESVYEFIKMLPQDGALLSVNRCGVHSKDNLLGPQVRSCEFEACGDDAIAIAGSWLRLDRIGPNGSLYLTSRANIELAPYFEFAFYQASDLQSLGRVVANNALTLGRDFARRLWTFRVDAPGIPTALQIGDLVVCTSLTARGFAVVGNHIRHHRARGILVKASQGEISDNDIRGSTRSAIVVGPEFGNFFEASFVEDLLISGNRISQVGLRAPAVIQGGAISVTATFTGPNAPLIDNLSRENRRIRIVDNFIRNVGQCGILVTATKNLEIRGNDLFSCQRRPFTPNAGIANGLDVPVNAALFLQNVEDVVLLNNRIEDPELGRCLYISPSSVNVSRTNNRRALYCGFETDASQPWPDAVRSGGTVNTHLNVWSHSLVGWSFVFQKWGLNGSAGAFPYHVDDQGARCEHGSGKFEFECKSPRAIQFDLGANFLGSTWSLGVEAIPLLGGSTQTVGTFGNNATDLIAVGPKPWFTTKRIPLGLPPGPYRIRLTRNSAFGASPYLYLDELIVEFEDL